MNSCLRWSRSALCQSLVALFVWETAFARPVQIIHTNDLHSFYEHGDSPASGGYAAVKATIDSLRLRAQEQGIESLVLDAGDFSEGSQFYLADEGRHSWRMMDAMGFDAIALGNHDWLIGTDQLDWLVGMVQPRTPFLSANFRADSKYANLARHILPSAEFSRAGLKIGVLGLSTDEFFYRWRVQNGEIASPVEVAREEVPRLKRRNDFVFALTHLGVDTDIELAAKTRGLDLIVGGHSHTSLSEPVYSKNPDKRQVPIVQAGQHGEYVGDLLVDLEPGKQVQVLRYQLVPVVTHAEQNRAIASLVEDGRTQLERRYGASWLYEVLAYSEIPLERPLYGPTEWGHLVGEAVRETAGADFTLDVGEFFGESLPPGPVTRENLIQFYPRVFDARKSSGWNVWTIKAPGWLIRLVLGEAARMGQYLNTTGLTYDIENTENGPWVKNLRVQGRKFRWYREYSIAVTEGIGRGSMEISFLLQAFFRPEDTGTPVWAAIENRLKAMGGVIRAGSTPLR